jgi:aspartate/methionine/tyrosine aminotransferase
MLAMPSLLSVAKRAQVPPFEAMEMLTLAHEVERRTGIPVVHMSLGQPGANVPQRVMDKVASMMNQQSKLGYTESAGILPLRQRIARLYQEQYGLELSPERIMVTFGASGALILALSAAFDAGARIGMVEPSYPAYRNLILALGMEPVLLPGDAEHDYQPHPKMLENLSRPLDGLMITSPANPTGTMLAPAALEAVIRTAEGMGTRIISDEIYHRMVFGDVKESTALATSREAIVINSFSKYYLMPGWRLGWAVVPESLGRAVECLAQSYFISPPTLSQLAGVEVFECSDELDKMVGIYATNRQILVDGLKEIGITQMCPPQGAFYVYANISPLAKNSKEFCREMLEKAHVAAVPGHDFDLTHGHEWMRLSYCGTTESIIEGVARMKRWMGK